MRLKKILNYRQRLRNCLTGRLVNKKPFNRKPAIYFFLRRIRFEQLRNCSEKLDVIFSTSDRTIGTIQKAIQGIM